MTPAATTKRVGTRDKMVISAAQVMRERGAAGVTIDSVLARSGAPRGSVYHHFPEGRNQILTEALRYAGDSITATIDNAVDRGAKALLREFVDFWERLLTECDFTAGCPVVAAAIGSADDELELSTESGLILGRWCTALSRAFVTDGFDDADAASLAVMSISALEGAIVLCRSTRSVIPLRQVGDQLEFLIKAREFVRRNGLDDKRAG
ncbi:MULTISPECIES: TetR/AcrR family transcriptional regulator [Mycobacterium]|uniref:TetR family transcriptional regulator n=1 Tax=Mycobacterium gordonae TaxID=1778 RepID=A0A1A6BK44_MYCGO|nr:MULTISPECIES: TetR/AcrR family transcriptional regulator [Mycobacterium]MBI2703359.1 TetR/AcrR family transcriptional regulator [Mycobacterium sp.]MBX9977975.1 TetR/AcrR family transcriptional regulator [Mycobacterium gordonae]MCQ4365131.1 TetR/AcrR family transcriptional regulator [Mycobacterium gordonae]MCV7006599.1 TetR/AcrR family transcriptional regulator [Mycobacterium gordonae]OBS02695.1 TetR family transcriptional regulator [Mycobacterium gordonae]